MATFTEGNLQITFPQDANVQKLDDPCVHGILSMKAVDFIVEEDDRLWLIEFEDPEHPNAMEK